MRKELSYSIWILPEGKMLESLSSIITDLSRHYGSPLFEPHIGLVGGFEGSEKDLLVNAQELSELIKPFEVRLSGIGHRDEFFRSLFVKVEKTDKFMQTYRAAVGMFEVDKHLYDESNFMPHLS